MTDPTPESGRELDVMEGHEFERTVIVCWKNAPPDARLDAVLAHEEALRGLLAECRAVMEDAAESPVEVHRRYRQEFAKLVREIDRAVRADTEGATPTGEEADDG